MLGVLRLGESSRGFLEILFSVIDGVGDRGGIKVLACGLRMNAVGNQKVPFAVRSLRPIGEHQLVMRPGGLPDGVM